MADKPDNDIETESLDKKARDFLANTEAPKSVSLDKIEIVNGTLYEVVMTGYEPDIGGDYGNYTRYDVIYEKTEKSFYLGSSVDQKTMNRYLTDWEKEDHKLPYKMKFVRYPRKSQNQKRTYYDIRAELLASGDNVKMK